MFNDDKLVLDTTELRLGWAIDDVCEAVAELTSRIEKTKDLQTVEALSRLLKALNTYIKVTGEAVHELY